MTEDDDDWLVALENTHKAVREFAQIEIMALARRVIYRLQRISASGIYGDDYIYKTLWDEYCHEAQEGPHELLETAWEITINPLLDFEIDRLPKHMAVLLTILAVWELGQNLDLVGSYWPDGIREVLLTRLGEKANVRRLYHLGPHRNY